MNEYSIRYEPGNEWLGHSGILGQKKGVITRYVGKYYIPKGRKGLERAEKRLGDDAKSRYNEFQDKMSSLESKHNEGKLSDKQHKKLVEKELKSFKKDQESFKDRYAQIKDGYKDADRNDINSLKKKKMADLTDEELDKLQERTKKEQMTSNFIKNTIKNEAGPSASSKDLVRSAENLSRTLNDLSRNAQRNAPVKKQKKADLSDKSDAEIRKMIERARLEQQYNDVVNTPEVKTGRVNAMAALAAVGTMAVVGTQVADFVITAKKLKE